jgi:trans-aconitate 2-methyltransferase
MVAEARKRLAGDADRVEFVVADLGRPLPIDGTVDAVLSTATFHWVLDHDALFRNLAAVMRPGAQLVAQCGGGDNIARVRRVLKDLGETWTPWNFAWPDETRERLADAGFEDIEVWLHDEPTEIPPEQLHDYLRTVVLGSNLLRREPDEREPFVRAVAERLGDGHLDYVRLNIIARRG